MAFDLHPAFFSTRVFFVPAWLGLLLYALRAAQLPALVMASLCDAKQGQAARGIPASSNLAPTPHSTTKLWRATGAQPLLTAASTTASPGHKRGYFLANAEHEADANGSSVERDGEAFPAGPMEDCYAGVPLRHTACAVNQTASAANSTRRSSPTKPCKHCHPRCAGSRNGGGGGCCWTSASTHGKPNRNAHCE